MASRCLHLLTVVPFMLLLLSSVEYVTSIKCYSCTSNTEKACSDPFNNVTIPASYCDITTSVCVKQVLPALGIIKESTFRGCVSDEYCKLFSNKSKFCTTCMDNYCNSAIKLQPLTTFILLPISYIYKLLS
ncbi:hypothetical protein PPYR_12519 [Photinus pyralis]|uniref:Uncharacterized protein n=1 Tax=Photinus pyralis TaxID=7054 RepID=A0A1Y1KZ47_PHOPY|nr:uncharacterized protein LOC116179242 [Photinus pyralis]KAB0792899.1 hypothetical protein PPYR_12519 [Photinus pyralis]